MRSRARISVCLSSAATVVLVAACGGGEPVFDAEEFVAEANRHQAGLLLGPSLQSSRDDAEVRELSLTEHEAAAGDRHGAHGGGSLAVMADGDAALAEYERCESSASLVCFRAANVVMLFEGALAPADLDRLEGALRTMASD